MKLNGQKWVFRDGNHEIIAENAWSWTLLFSQTRIQINGETVYAKSGYFWVAVDWTSAHSEPWVTQLGGEELSVEFRSEVNSINIRAMIGDRELELVDYFEGSWRGRKDEWPDELPSSL